jgi:hypothetical protein
MPPPGKAQETRYKAQVRSKVQGTRFKKGTRIKEQKPRKGPGRKDLKMLYE